MAILDVLPVVDSDIDGVLGYTRRRFGVAKAIAYADLIVVRMGDLRTDPRCGHRRVDIHPDVWVHHLGHGARHLFLYEFSRLGDLVRVYGLLYDGRDLAARWRERRDA